MVFIYALYIDNFLFKVNVKRSTVNISETVREYFKYSYSPYNMWYDRSQRIMYIYKQKDVANTEKIHKLLLYTTSLEDVVDNGDHDERDVDISEEFGSLDRPPKQTLPALNELVRQFALAAEKELGMKNPTLDKISHLFNLSEILMAVDCAPPESKALEKIKQLRDEIENEKIEKNKFENCVEENGEDEFVEEINDSSTDLCPSLKSEDSRPGERPTSASRARQTSVQV